jgi:2-polyprenyl-3-methyl-5-hydroxy-6-metoxy-1,4-benzoquinol methylase
MTTQSSCTVPCNLCEGRDVEQIGSVDRDGNPLRTVICRRCGLVWTDPRPSSQANRRFYSEDYRLKYKATFAPKMKHVYRETLRAIARFRELQPVLKPGIRLLDVGSSAGFFLYVARSQGIEVQGIEPNKGFASFAVSELGVPTIHGFSQDAEIAAESFDVVTFNHVLEHVEDPCSSICQAKQWLRDDGLLVIEVPNIEATYHAPSNRFHIGHLYSFNPANLEQFGVKARMQLRRSKLITASQHLHVTFQKRAAALSVCDDFALPGNYERISSILKTHSSLAHFTSTVPYTRFLQKQWGYVCEQLAIHGETSPQKLVDSLIAENLASRQRCSA